MRNLVFCICLYLLLQPAGENMVFIWAGMIFPPLYLIYDTYCDYAYHFSA